MGSEKIITISYLHEKGYLRTINACALPIANSTFLGTKAE